MAVWTTAYVNSLPKSSFAWIGPDGEKHLPYKDASGKVDLAHVRNALARLNQVKGMPANVQKTVRAKLEAALKSKNASDVGYYFVLNAYKALSEAEIETVENHDLKWINAFPFGEFAYGDETVVFNKDRADRMVKNFTDGIRVLGDNDLCIDYDHMMDSAKGGKAAGWIKGVEARDDGLYVGAEFTPGAITEIENKEWKYLSPSYYDEFGDVEDVLKGLALTNQPVIRNIPPINFSEVAEIEKEVNENVSDDDKKAAEEAAAKMKELSEARAKMLSTLGLAEDATDEDMVAKAEEIAETAATVDKALAEADEMKELSEKFPAYAKRLAKLETDGRESAAKSFSESYLRKGDIGLAPVVVGKIGTFHKELSERGLSDKPLAAILDGIFEKGGLIDYRERGTSETDTGEKITDEKQAVKAFSEAMQVHMSEGKDAKEALELTAKEHPDLWKAYVGGGE